MSTPLSGSRTNWRMVLAFLLLAGASALSVALNVRTTDKTTTIHQQIKARGAPCVEIRLPNGVRFPSAGCERLARLLSETCTLNPTLCTGLAHHGHVSQHRIAQAVARALRRQRRGQGPPLRPGQTEVHARRTPVAHAPLPRPQGQSNLPSSEVAPTVPPPPPSPPPRPTATDVAGNTGRRVTDTANDATDALGLGRPVPPPPPLHVPPPICPRSPIC